MAVAKVRLEPEYTLEDWLALPEGPPYYEFEDGKLMPSPRPTPRHQEIEAALIAALHPFVQSHRLGKVWPEIDVPLPTGYGYAPDIVYLNQAHLDAYEAADGQGPVVPDLVVEVLSPSTVARDRVVKFRNYHRARVPWYWIVDPEALSIEEYRWEPEGYLRVASLAQGEVFQPILFPGLEIDLQALVGESKA